MNKLIRDGIREEQAHAMAHIKYDPITGEMTRMDATVRGPTFVRGNDTRKTDTIMINGEKFSRGKLAWLISYGWYPKDRVYHIDGNKANCALNNLTLLPQKRKRAGTSTE